MIKKNYEKEILIMKVRGATEKDCRKCRENLWFELQYDVFSNCIDSAAISAAVMSIGALDGMGFTDEQLKEFFDRYVLISSMTSFFGEPVKEVDIKEKYEKRLGIDFDKIECHYETKHAFMARVNRERKENK